MTTILVADDDEQLRSTLQRMLATLGHKVLLACNEIEASNILLGGKSVELVITDIIMPDMEGLRLLRELRERWPSLKLIAISGGGRSGAFGLLDAAEQLGADMVLRKPFRLGALIEAITAVMQPQADKTSP